MVPSACGTLDLLAKHRPFNLTVTYLNTRHFQTNCGSYINTAKALWSLIRS